MESVGSARLNPDNRTTEAPPITKSRLQEDSFPQKDPLPSTSAPRGKEYSRLKLTAGIAQGVLLFLFNIFILAVGFSKAVELFIRGFFENDYLVLLGFSFILGVLQSFLSVPLKFYSGFYLEHAFDVSNQSLPRWLWEGLKGLFVGILLMTPLLLALYYCLQTFGQNWWLPVGIMLFLFSILLSRLAPVVIFPLFYKFTPLPDGSLRQRVLRLCDRVGTRVSAVYVFDMSKNTRKANAAFAGIGKSKRIILGDNLVREFGEEEVETVFAHELGHRKLNHVWTAMTVGAASTFVGLFLTARLYEMTLPVFGFSEIGSVAALPLLSVFLGIYSLVTSPVGNMLSRSHEKAADRYAVQVTGNKGAFVNALKKLGKQNLADESPHPLVEFLFYSHPSIGKRVRAIERM